MMWLHAAKQGFISTTEKQNKIFILPSASSLASSKQLTMETTTEWKASSLQQGLQLSSVRGPEWKKTNS
ncbi:unnamed protein product, partial [Vitis vinifera]